MSRNVTQEARIDGERKAWTAGAQAFLSRGGRTFQLTGGTEHAYSDARIVDDTLQLTRVDGTRIVTSLSGRLPPLPRDVDEIFYTDMYGQSLAAGIGAEGVVHAAPFNDRYLMFQAGQRSFGHAMGHNQGRIHPSHAPDSAIRDLKRGHETMWKANTGETSNSAFAGGLLQAEAFPRNAAILTTCSAVGSAKQEMLWRRATLPPSDKMAAGDPWANLEKKFVRAALLARINGLGFVAGPLRYNQGEANMHRTAQNYLAGLKIVRADWQALALAWNAVPTLGGSMDIPFVVAQTCSGAFYGTPKSEVPSAQLLINIEDPRTALCIGPLYDQTFAADGGHVLADGQVMQGARQAVAYGEWLKGLLWHPLCVRGDPGFAPARTGRRVILRLWNHFDLPLMFDTRTVTGLSADQGFEWQDDGDGDCVRVVGADILDETTIALTLSDVPTGSNGRIEIAMNGQAGEKTGPAVGNRSTLRTDGATARTSDGRAVEHFVCIDRKAVASD